MPIYLRSQVFNLHTEERWLQEGMQLKPNREFSAIDILYLFVEQPTKRLAKRMDMRRKRKLQEMEEGETKGEGEMSEYFGEWQIEKYQPGRVVVRSWCVFLNLICENGIIPKNKFGNVWLYNKDMLPEGATIMYLDNIQRIARKLQIDWAEAVVLWFFLFSLFFEFYSRLDGVMAATRGLYYTVSWFRLSELLNLRGGGWSIKIRWWKKR